MTVNLILATVGAVGAALLLLGLSRAVFAHESHIEQWVQPPREAWSNPRKVARASRRGSALPAPLKYLEGRLKAAGVDWSPGYIAGMIAGVGLGAGLLAWVVLGIPWVAALATAVGFYAPVWRLNKVVAARAERVMGQLDQVCTGLIQSVSGGYDLLEAIKREAKRTPDPTGYELRRIVERHQGGEYLNTVLEEFAERVDLEEARLFAVGLELAFEEGAKVVPVLQSIQRSLRNRRELQGLVRELTVANERQSMVMAAIPLVLFPVLRLMVPGYTQPLFGTPGGQILIFLDLLWMIFGLQLARKWLGGMEQV